jgi:tRNA(Ile2) C34 agmatinyltransferase TiaS
MTARDSDGAPIYGGVSDPAATSGPVTLPRYTPSYVASCPECCGDCQHEGVDGYWCPACQRSWSFAEVGYLDEGHRDGD